MTCALCGLQDGTRTDFIDQVTGDIVWRCECRRCGTYLISGMLASDIEHWRTQGNPGALPVPYPTDQWHLVSAQVRQLALRGGRPPQISEETVSSMISSAPRGVVEQLDRLLLGLAAQSSRMGQELPIDPSLDFTLGYCRDAEELEYLLQHLADVGLIELRLPERASGVMLTVQGWANVQEIQKRIGQSNQIFVAMNFDPDLASLYSTAIEPAIRDAGYDPLMMAALDHADRIDERIEVELRRSVAIVADFTGQKHGVYFEAGFARGQGIPVIWTCRATESTLLHFDTRQYNHILWESESDLKGRLETRIRVLLG